MATRQDNADALNALLGVQIDATQREPLAPVLEEWAKRAETEPDAVKLEILTSQLEDRLGIEIPEGQTADQLAEWLANEDDDAVVAAITGEEPEPDDELLTLIVQVSEKVAAYGGTYTDPDQPEGHRVIGGGPVRVAPTALINAGLKNGTLTESE
ncbi:hypothetical protein [Deinococcus marmoris]|uniref:Uncharacterized protein n=1 Tax=Deinococcus marmoris TaxID=249408 RepID=A0A1U7P4Y2_9DEIO|nr:hypothetical protein [Deinococcus marmoris]OLV20216.1 hypothetical protein BOO71_0000676 [Deinococcus marmoris]